MIDTLATSQNWGKNKPILRLSNGSYAIILDFFLVVIQIYIL